MDLLRDDLKKLYFKFLIPSLGSAMVMSIYTLTDAIVIGKGVGADATLYPYAMSYMHYINMFLLGGVFNIVMDIVLVFPLKQEIGGAALASVVGMLIQVLVASSHFLSKKNELRFIMPHRILNSMKNIVTAGIPSFFNEFANGFIVRAVLTFWNPFAKGALCISPLRNIILSNVCILTFPVLIGGNSLWFAAPVTEAVTLTDSLVFLARESKR